MAAPDDTSTLGETAPKAAPGAAVKARLTRSVRARTAAFIREARSNELSQILGCALIGILTGAVVEAVHRLVELLHKIDFMLPGNLRLSEGIDIDRLRIIFVPAIGGLLLGGTAHLVRNRLATNIVDPIEANALHGGRMSFRDSCRLLLATIVSNASGASLGMEAGYSQIGAAIFSRIGQHLHLRRDDLRIFTTAGAAAAIAAAFDAPLAGTFYGYELVLGSYMPRALAPVAIASLAATLTQRALGPSLSLFTLSATPELPPALYLVFALLGVAAAAFSILAMRSVTWAERGLRGLRVPDWLMPASGGVVLSIIALAYPQVLGGGYGAIQYHLEHAWPLIPLVALLIAKLIASAISVSSGYRGGLFSSSLFLGGLFGAIASQILAIAHPDLATERIPLMIVGMGSVAAGIIGAPLTMAFLVLEATGSFSMTVGVLVGVVTASTIVRLTFGYSFSTWRFHVRGLPIRGAHDIGWLADMTADKLMRTDPVTVPADLRLRELRQKVPLGAGKQVFVVDSEDRYAGLIDMVAAHDSSLDDRIDSITAGNLATAPTLYLVPNENVRSALARFEASKREILPVVSVPDRKILGYLTEAYALRRYMEEFERRRSEELGDKSLFSIGQLPE